MSDELPLNDARRPEPSKGSVAWTVREWRKFRQLSSKHGGLTSTTLAAIAIGISRQRVWQLVNSGHLRMFEIMGKQYLACDDVEEFAKLERSSGFRYAEVA
jgi:hypothetical protein